MTLYVGLSALRPFPFTNLGLRPRLVFCALSALFAKPLQPEGDKRWIGAVCYARGTRLCGATMLLELRVENYAVIDQAVAGFGPGLNLLTGETGAGKSILIDALALLLGGKASSDVVRHGAEKAVLGCVFESTPGAAAVLDANGIDAGAFS